MSGHPLVTPPEVGRPVGVVRCMGCVDGIVVKAHHCAGDRPLLIVGGFCQCPQPGCGPARSTQRPKTRR